MYLSCSKKLNTKNEYDSYCCSSVHNEANYVLALEFFDFVFNLENMDRHLKTVDIFDNYNAMTFVINDMTFVFFDMTV